MNSTDQDLVYNRTTQLCEHLTNLWNKRNSNYAAQVDVQKLYSVHSSRKYYKIIETDHCSREASTGGSVHAFVDKVSGAVYKPASWKAPAKHVRYQLLDDASFNKCMEVADCYGSYLYMRWPLLGI